MAAVLCKGCGDCFVACCTGPCKACASCCGSCCKGCGKFCGSCCNGCVDVCSSPFILFVIVTVIAQGPPVALGLMELVGLPGCQGSVWLVGAIVLGAANIAAAFYMAIKINDRENQEMQHLRTAFSRATHLLCHDGWIAVYILIFLGFCVWLFVGSGWVWTDIDEDEQCTDTVAGNARMAVGFGWFFLIGGSMALTLGVCCSCLDRRDYGNDNAYPQANHGMPGGGIPSPQQQQQQQQQQQHYNNQVHYTQDNSQKPPPTTYSADGKPVHNSGQEVPFAQAYAQSPPPPTAPPSGYDSTRGSSGRAQVPPQNTEPESFESKAAAAVSGNIGSKFGRNVGKLFTKDERKQQDIENQGKKVGEAVGKGFVTAKNFVNSKINNKNEKMSSNV